MDEVLNVVVAVGEDGDKPTFACHSDPPGFSDERVSVNLYVYMKPLDSAGLPVNSTVFVIVPSAYLSASS